MAKYRLNTKAETAELEAARLKVGSTYKHIASWVYETCGCSTHLVDPPKCDECKRRVGILNRSNSKLSCDRKADDLRAYGYTVIEPHIS